MGHFLSLPILVLEIALLPRWSFFGIPTLKVVSEGRRLDFQISLVI